MKITKLFTHIICETNKHNNDYERIFYVENLKVLIYFKNNEEHVLILFK